MNPSAAPSRVCAYCRKRATVVRDLRTGPALERIVPRQPLCRFCAQRYGTGPMTAIPLSKDEEAKRKDIDARLRLIR